MRSGSMEGRRAWLLALGLAVVSIAVTAAQPAGGPAPSSSLIFNIGASSLTADPTQYCCSTARAGTYVDILSCESDRITRVGNDAYPSCRIRLAGFSTEGELTRNFNFARAQAIPGGVAIAGSVRFTDVNECDVAYYECSPNADCTNSWGTFTCRCRDGYEDQSTGRPGSICRTDRPGPPRPPGSSDDDNGPFSPIQDLEIWQWVLVAVAIFIVLMLILCCCCFYSDCYCYDNEVKRRVIRRVKVIQQPVPVPAPAPAPCGGCAHSHNHCTCAPPRKPEEQKIVIQLEQPALPPPPQLALPAPPPQVIQAPIPYGPVPSGPSAFIANSGFDGNVYVAAPSIPEPVRTVPWSEGAYVVGAPPVGVAEVQTIQIQPQTVQVQPQYIAQEPMYQDISTPQVMYATTSDQTNNGMMYFD